MVSLQGGLKVSPWHFQAALGAGARSEALEQRVPWDLGWAPTLSATWLMSLLPQLLQVPFLWESLSGELSQCLSGKCHDHTSIMEGKFTWHRILG